MENRFDVIAIGGGQSGLPSLKHLESLNVINAEGKSIQVP